MSTLAWSLTRNHNDLEDYTLEDRTYVSTHSFFPANDPTRPRSQFIFFFKLIRRYYNGVTQTRSADPQAGLTDHEVHHEFSLPFHYLIGDSGEAAVIGMLAGIRTLFQINGVVFWKEPGTYRTAERLTSLTDIVYRVSDIAGQMISAACGRRTLILQVTIEKRVAVVDRAYRTLMEHIPIRSEETVVNHSPVVDDEIQIAETLHTFRFRVRVRVRARESGSGGSIRVTARQSRSGGSGWVTDGDKEWIIGRSGWVWALDRLGRASKRRVARPPESRIDFMSQTGNDRRSCFSRSVQAARPSEHGGSGEGDDGGDRRCMICLEDMFGESESSCMPCSHGFHSECIAKWFKKSYTCPICRCSLRFNTVMVEF